MTAELAMVPIALAAAVVNGALGHGFSTITVPLALLVSTARVVNPALVPIEVVINAYVLFTSRGAVPTVARRVLPVIAGLAPGIVAGAWLVAWLDATQLKILVFAALLPLLLLQAAGVRHRLPAERAVAVPFGTAIGVLYAMTTISGPPLALALNNQGLRKRQFRAALALIRLAESTVTAIVYAALGLYTVESAALALSIVPSVLLGVPLGTLLVVRVGVEMFRRVCISFDVWVVGFGLAHALVKGAVAAPPVAYGLWTAVGLLDVGLLWSFFVARRRRADMARAAAPSGRLGVAR